MDILLINSSVKNYQAHAAMTPPLGLAYIGAVLREAGFSVAAVDMNVSPLREELLSDLPLLVGISAYTETYNTALQVAKEIKRRSPQTKVVIGGPHVSVTWKTTAMEPSIDAVSLGEGEITWLELAEHYLRSKRSLADIKGLAFRQNEKVICTADREPIAEIDTLPFPARDLFPLEKYRLPVALLTSRGGCPFACNFCAVNNIWKGKRRFRSPEKIIEEIDYVMQHYRFDILNFSDDSFTLNRERTIKLCVLMKERYGFMGIPWQCATRVDLVDEELIRVMRRAGCQTIQFGVESGSQKILDAIGKKIRLEQVMEAVKLAQKFGMEVLCSFMFPHPEDTEETIDSQIALMRQLADMGCQLSLALTTPYPGTPLAKTLESVGMKVVTSDYDNFDCQHLIVETKRFDLNALKEQLYKMVSQVGLLGELK